VEYTLDRVAIVGRTVCPNRDEPVAVVYTASATGISLQSQVSCDGTTYPEVQTFVRQ
jgi:hypothetical protein